MDWLEVAVGGSRRSPDHSTGRGAVSSSPGSGKIDPIVQPGALEMRPYLR